MKIYGSTQYIEKPKVGDLKLEVNSMWSFGSRDVCFQTIESTFGGGTTVIGYDLKECIEVVDEKTHHTKWKQADMNNDIVNQLLEDGYSIAKQFNN